MHHSSAQDEDVVFIVKKTETAVVERGVYFYKQRHTHTMVQVNDVWRDKGVDSSLCSKVKIVGDCQYYYRLFEKDPSSQATDSIYHTRSNDTVFPFKQKQR